MFEKALEREKLAQELVFLTNLLEKVRMDSLRFKILEEDLSELNKDEKEMLFKIDQDILKSSKSAKYYYTPGFNIFIETNYIGIKAFIEEKRKKLEQKEEKLKKKVIELEKRLVELDKELNKNINL
jgi:prefoldin subunit 5